MKLKYLVILLLAILVGCNSPLDYKEYEGLSTQSYSEDGEYLIEYDTKNQRVIDLLDEGYIEYYENENYELAIKIFEEANTIEETTAANIFLSEMYVITNRSELALLSAEKLITSKNKLHKLEGFYYLSIASSNLGNKKKALAYLGEYKNYYIDVEGSCDQDCIYFLMLMYYDLEEYNKVEEIAKEFKEGDLEYEQQVNFYLSLVAQKKGDYNSFETYSKNFIDLEIEIYNIDEFVDYNNPSSVLYFNYDVITEFDFSNIFLEKACLGSRDIDFFIRYRYTNDSFWLELIKDKSQILNFELLFEISILLNNKEFDKIEKIILQKFSKEKIQICISSFTIKEFNKLLLISLDLDKKLVLKLDGELDMLSKKILISSLNSLSKKDIKKIIFKNFDQKGIYELLDKKILDSILRTTKNQITYNSFLSFKLLEDKLSKFIDLSLPELEEVLKKINNFPLSRFYFTKEEKERIQWAFPLFNENQINILKQVLINLDFFYPEIEEVLSKSKITSNCEFAIGFTYEDQKLIKKRFYLINIKQDRNLINEIFELMNIPRELLTSALPYCIDIDFYPTKKEFKLYYFHQENSLFKLDTIFENKPFELVFKYDEKNKMILGKKYGFFLEHFSKNEIDHLISKKIIEKNSEYVSFYVNEKNEIIKKLNYYKIT